MHQMLEGSKGYWISSLRIRRELIPVPEQRAYRCITTAPDDPVEGDTLVKDQTAFDELLVELGVYERPNAVHRGFNALWRKAGIDGLVPLKRSKEPRESLLYLLDSPHRPR